MNSYVSQTAEQHLSALAEQVKRLRSNGIPSDGVLELLDEIERAADLVTRDEEVARPEHPFPDSEQLYRAIGEVVPDFLWSCTAKGVPVFANRRWHDYTGISFDPADGISMDVIPMDVLHHPLDYPRLVATWTKSRTDRTPYECEFRLRRRDGVYRWFHVRCIPIFDPTGEVTHWIGTTTDVHESKLVQESLESSEDRFRTTFEQVAVGIVHFSPTGEWIRVNQRFCDMVGYERDELLRTRFQNITHPDDFDIDMPQLREMLFGRLRHYTVEKRYIHKSGDLVWVNIWVSMVVDAGQEDLSCVNYRVDLLISGSYEQQGATSAVVAEMRRQNPGLKELHTTNVRTGRPWLDDDAIVEANYLARPFTPSLLAGRVRELLNGLS